MVDSVKPDIIVGTESWLRPDIMNSEIFPSNYTVYCCDGDTSGGGVFIAVIDEILSTRQQHLKTSCEMAWAKISVVHTTDRKLMVKTSWTSCLVHLIGLVIPRTATFGLLVMLTSMVSAGQAKP